MRFSIAVLIFLPALVVAQGSLTPCILGCASDSLSGTNCQAMCVNSFRLKPKCSKANFHLQYSTDFACVCTSQAFQTAAASCLKSKCTAEEQQYSLQLSQQNCKNCTLGASLSVSVGLIFRSLRRHCRDEQHSRQRHRRLGQPHVQRPKRYYVRPRKRIQRR